jgi:peptide/nickel transport system permease protein
MISYVLRRLALGVVTLFLITALVYGLIRAMPGSPLDTDPAMMDPSMMASPDEYKRMAAYYGLDKPPHVAYFIWVNNMLLGDLGDSTTYHKPVSELLYQRMGPTLQLSIPSLLLSYLIAVPVGLYLTVRSKKLDERIVSVLLFGIYSIATFVTALMLQVLFGLYLNDTIWELPLYGRVSDDYDSFSFGGKVSDILRHMAIPLFCFTYSSLAYYSRFVKVNTQEAIRQDYIRTARAKGVGKLRVLFSHAFRNSLIPFVTLLGLTLPSLLSGAIILEEIFKWPGMGSLFFEAMTRRDYPVIMGLTLLFSVLTLLGQLIADIAYAFVDPRISYR